MEDPGLLVRFKHFWDPTDFFSWWQIFGQILVLLFAYWFCSIVFLKFHCWYQGKTPEELQAGWNMYHPSNEPPAMWTFLWPIGAVIYFVYFLVFGPQMIVQRSIHVKEPED